MTIIRELQEADNLDDLINLKNILTQSMLGYVDKGHIKIAEELLTNIASVVGTQNTLAKKLGREIPKPIKVESPFAYGTPGRLVTDALSDPSSRIQEIIGRLLIKMIKLTELQQLYDYQVAYLIVLIEGFDDKDSWTKLQTATSLLKTLLSIKLKAERLAQAQELAKPAEAVTTGL